MHRSSAVLALLAAPAVAAAAYLLAPAVLAGPATGATVEARQDEVSDFVDRQLESARSEDPERLWERALALRAAADVLGAEAVDAALDARLAGALTGNERLLAVAARAQGASEDASGFVDQLLGIVDGDDARTAAVAAEFLWQRPIATALDRTVRNDLATKLLDRADAADRAPEARIALARAAFEFGDGTTKRRAKAALEGFLASSQPEVRGHAALALAETGASVTGQLALELTALSKLPGDSGRLAASYLRIDDVERTRRTQLTELQRRLTEKVLPEDLGRFEEVLELVDREHLDGQKVTRDELVEAALNGMLHLLDEHSTYLNPKEYADFMGDLEAEYGGIGAYVQNDPVDNLFTITRPIYSGPAYRAGLQSDDKIVKVDDWPTLGHTQEDVIKRLKGKPGTTVRLYVWRRGMDVSLIDRPDETMVHEVERRIIHVPAVQAELMPGGVAMIELSTFSRGVGAELAQAVRDMLGQGATSVVIDLRRNGGGLLSEAVEVASVFLPLGSEVVHTEYRNEQPQTLRTRRKPIVPPEMPVAVLIGRFTASASEIVSGALQDHGRATLVGTRSFGKGSVQNFFPLQREPEDEWDDENRNGMYDPWEKITVDHDHDGEFDFAPRVKLTIAHYLLPSGRSIHREISMDGDVLSEGGVRPDAEVPPDTIEGWRWTEMRRVRDELHVPREYVDAHWEANHDLFVQLARTDLRDPSLWPDFDELYLSTPSALSRDDLRRLLRDEVRRRIQDERGAAFPLGDFEEDSQVQRAIQAVYQRVDRNWQDVPEFRATFVEPSADQANQDLLARVAADRALERLLDRLRSSGEHGLDATQVHELIDLIESRSDR